MTIFPLFQNALRVFLGFFLSSQCLTCILSLSNQLLFKIPFSLGLLEFYFFLCILCVCMWDVYATAYICYVWAEDNCV